MFPWKNGIRIPTYSPSRIFIAILASSNGPQAEEEWPEESAEIGLLRALKKSVGKRKPNLEYNINISIARTQQRREEKQRHKGQNHVVFISHLLRR